MSVDTLQEKIRKTKNPSVVLLEAMPDWIPPHILEEEGSTVAACRRFYRELLAGLKGTVPCVRFGFGSFALLGPEGLAALSALLHEAKAQGFYVLLDAPEVLSALAAQNAASVLSRQDGPYPCDAVVVSAYLGGDVLRPFLELCASGKAVFPVVRTANRSAPELQDLLTGARLVHTAAADIVSRMGESCYAKCGYSQMGALASASAADSLRSLRAKYKRMFLLLDGYDYPNANAKNCSYAFDNLGHGAAACAGSAIAAAWKQADSDGRDFADLALQEALRMKKNLTRYVTVL